MVGIGRSQNMKNTFDFTDRALASVKRYQSCYLGDQGGGGRLLPTVTIRYSTAALGRSDATRTTTNYLFRSPRKKNDKVATRITNK